METNPTKIKPYELWALAGNFKTNDKLTTQLKVRRSVWPFMTTQTEVSSSPCTRVQRPAKANRTHLQANCGCCPRAPAAQAICNRTAFSFPLPYTWRRRISLGIGGRAAQTLRTLQFWRYAQHHVSRLPGLCINDQRIQQRFLAEPGLTFAKAMELAQAAEPVGNNARQLERAIPTGVNKISSARSKEGGAHCSLPTTTPCYHCGGTNHRADECWFRESDCCQKSPYKSCKESLSSLSKKIQRGCKSTSQRSRKRFQLKYNPDNHWSSALYRNLNHLQYIVNVKRDDAAGFRLDTFTTHKLHCSPVVLFYMQLIQIMWIAIHLCFKLQATILLPLKQQEVCVRVVKAALVYSQKILCNMHLIFQFWIKNKSSLHKPIDRRDWGHSCGRCCGWGAVSSKSPVLVGPSPLWAANNSFSCHHTE